MKAVALVVVCMLGVSCVEHVESSSVVAGPATTRAVWEAADGMVKGILVSGTGAMGEFLSDVMVLQALTEEFEGFYGRWPEGVGELREFAVARHGAGYDFGRVVGYRVRDGVERGKAVVEVELVGEGVAGSGSFEVVAGGRGR